nr:MAG TPA: minor tail protein [Caudoviricetes sp.]
MADVDITSLSVEISAESQGAELNINKLATAISNLRTKGNVTKVVNSLDRLSASISALKSASAGLSGLDKLTGFLDKLSGTDLSASAKSINSVGNAIKKIAAVDIGGIDLSGLSGKMSELQSGLSPLAGLDASGLKGIGSAINALGKIPGLTNKLDSSTLDAFAKACEKISTSLTPLASQLDKVGNAFAKLPPQLSKVVTQANRVTAANEKQRKSYLSLSNQMNGFMRNMAKLISLKAIAEYLGNAAAKFNDFYEATDMFTVSMGEMTESANQFINKMESLLGIDPTEAMNNMANVYSMVHSFGMASDKAYTLSQNLTQLGYDLASLKNMNPSETFTKLRSAMAGELEPVLQLGVDISQARLKQELLELGFNKQISTLSQADKATLRYIAIMKQLTYVQGNLGETLSSPANMIRMLKAQLNNLARDIGSLLYPALKSILPPLIAAVELVREFVQWVAKLMGVEVTFTDFSKNAGSVGEIGDAMDETTDSTKKAAKALKDYTMGFDELNIIDPNKGGKSSSSGASAGNILGDVDLSGYDMFKQYNEDFAKQIDAIKQKIKDMLPTIGAVGAAFAAWQISKALLDALDKIKNFTINAKVDISWPVIGVLAFMSDMNEFKKYLEDFLKNGPTFKNVAGMISEFAGMMGDALILLGNLKLGGALKVVQGIGEIIIAIKDIADNGLNLDNATTAIRGLTNVAIGIGALTGHLKVAGWALAIQGFTSIIQEIANNWEAIKNGDWSGVDKATLVIGALEVFGGIATALGVFSKLKAVKESTESVQSVKTVADATQNISNATSSLSPNLTSLAKNLAVGVAIVAEVSAAAILFAGAIVVLGNELKAAGDAWQPVITNAKEVAEAVGLGSVALVAVGAVAAGIGSAGGVPLAANIGIGTAILAEVGAAAVLFEAEVWAVGTGLDKIRQAWAPVTENAPTVKTALIAGTALLVAVGAATAAIGIATTATGGTIPIAIGIGTAVLVECAVAFVALTDSISSVADELTGKLYPSLKNLNSKLPSIKTGMSSLTGYLKDFASELSSYTSSMGSVTWSSIVNGFQKLFAGNPIASLANDVGGIYDDTVVLSNKLSVANPELERAVQLLTDYNLLMSQLKLLTEGANNTQLATDIFTNLEDCGEKLVTGFVSGINKKLSALDTEVGKIKASLEKISDEETAFKKYGGYILQGLIDGLDGKKNDVYTKIVEIGNALADKFANAMDIHSPSKLFRVFGGYIVEGLANGINAALPYVEQAMNNLANAVQEKGNELIDYGSSIATGFVDNVVNALNSKWNEIDSGLKNDFVGTIKSMFEAVKNGDIQTVATNTAAIIWQAMGEENRSQVKSYASNLISTLTGALKGVGAKALVSAKSIGKNILIGITSKFGEIASQAVGLGSKLTSTFSSLTGPLAAVGKAISTGLSSGVLSQFPSIITGVAGLIGSIGTAFSGLLSTIGGVLSSLGIPTGFALLAGGVAIVAAIAGIVGSLNSKYGSNSSVSNDYSSYPGTSGYDSSTGSTTSTGSYYPSSSTSGVSASDLRSAVHDGCYNAFLDIFQRYGDEITGGKEIKLFIDGKQITASVEKQQSDRGVQIMGTEVYSY